MKIERTLLKRTAVAAAVAMAIGGVATVSDYAALDIVEVSLIASAYADEGGSGKGGPGKGGAKGDRRGGGGGPDGSSGQGYQGGRSMSDVLADDEGEDSDRPEWAGTPGRDNKPGRPSAGSDNQKGGEYGDLFVILRNDDGTAVTTASGEHYILLADGTVIVTVDGEVPEGTNAELLQAVEFGRMNIARAPASVMEHSLTEALSKLDGLVITADNIGDFTDPGGRLVVDGSTIDSPLENLALYEALLLAEPNDEGMLVVTATSSHDGGDTVYTMLVDPSVRLDLAASAIAASSDKTGELTIDEVYLITSFLGAEDALESLVENYTYDRFATYDVTVSVWQDQPDGSRELVDVNLFATLTADDGDAFGFNTVERPYLDADGVLQVDDNATGIDIFTQAADDAVQAIEFVHEFQ